MSNTFILGTAVKIETIFEEPVDSVTIKIEDPSNQILVNNVAMTKVIDKVYEYVYQTLSTGTEGTCIVTLTTTVGNNITVKQEFFDVFRPAPFSAINAN